MSGLSFCLEESTFYDILPALKYGVSCSLKIPYVFVAEGI